MNLDRKKIICIVPYRRGGGKVTFIERQVESLEKQKVDLIRFYLSPQRTLRLFFKALKKANKIIRNKNILLVHSFYGSYPAFFACVVSMINRKPLVITFHGSDLNVTYSTDGVIRDIVQRLLSNISALFAKRIICVSKNLLEKLWWKEENAIIIPCGVDIGLFKPISKRTAKNLLAWPETEKVILFNQGNKAKVKRKDIAENVISLLLQKKIRCRLEIVTNIKYEKMPLYLNASDCLLVCSNSEGSPMIVKEALACNLPIVSVDVGDVKERIKNVSQSKIVSKNYKEIAGVISNIFNSNKRSNGRKNLKFLSEQEVAERIAKIYQTVDIK